MQNLKELTLGENKSFVSTKTKIFADNAFDNLVNIYHLHLEVPKIIEFNSWALLKNKPNLQVLAIMGILRTFPEYIPSTVEDLDLSFTFFTRLTRANLENLKNLRRLSLYFAKLRTVDEDTFDDCENLKDLFLNNNEIERITKRHFKALTKLEDCTLMENSDTMNVDFMTEELGFTQGTDRWMSFTRNVTLS